MSARRELPGGAWLGREDPLAVALARREAAVAAVRAVALAGVLAGAGAAAGRREAVAVLAAAVVVLAVVGLRALALGFEVREGVLERIRCGEDEGAPPAVARVRARLLDPANRERLARRLERMGEAPSAPGVRRLANRRAIAESGPLLAAVAAGLRQADPDPGGVAAAQQLLCDGASALYGADPARLGQELRRIAFLLQREP